MIINKKRFLNWLFWILVVASMIALFSIMANAQERMIKRPDWIKMTETTTDTLFIYDFRTEQDSLDKICKEKGHIKGDYYHSTAMNYWTEIYTCLRCTTVVWRRFKIDSAIIEFDSIFYKKQIKNIFPEVE